MGGPGLDASVSRATLVRGRLPADCVGGRDLVPLRRRDPLAEHGHDAARCVPRVRGEPRRNGARAVAGAPGDARRARARRGRAPGCGVRDVVAARAAAAAARAGAGGAARGRVEPGDGGLPRLRAGGALVRAGAGPHGAGEQRRRARLPPGEGGGLGAARRLLLDPRRADRAHERVPAARRAAAALPLRRDRERRAHRDPAVRRRARDPRRGLRRVAAARLRCAAGRVRRVPARDVLAARAGGADGAERPRRGVVPGDRGVPPARRRPLRAGARGRGRRVRARREALDGARAADPGLARARARAAHVRMGRRRRAGRVRGDRHVGLRAQRRPLRDTSSVPTRAPSRTAPRPLPAERRERLQPRLRDDGRVRPLEPAYPRARDRRAS